MDVEAQLHRLDMRWTLHCLLNWMASFRTSNRLFMLFRGPHKGDMPSKASIAWWLKEVIGSTYLLQSQPVPEGLQVHSTLVQAASRVKCTLVLPGYICRMAMWESLHTFIHHYCLSCSHVRMRDSVPEFFRLGLLVPPKSEHCSGISQKSGLDLSDAMEGEIRFVLLIFFSLLPQVQSRTLLLYSG